MKSEFSPFARLDPAMFSGRAVQLHDFLAARERRLLDLGDKARDALDTPEKVRAHARRMRETFVEKLGGIPRRDCPLNARTTKTLKRDGFTLECVEYLSRTGVYNTASLYLPDGLPESPSPAVLFLSGHSDNGRMYDRYQAVCQILAHAGLVVLAPDPLGQGERKSFFDPETGSCAVGDAVSDHDACGVPAVAAGRFLGAYVASDLMAAVDYMLTRPEIDPGRIGATGCSGGGTQTMYLMTCDDRIAAAAPATFTTTRREILGTNQSQDSEQIWPGCAQYGFDHFEPFLIFAPKPVRILAVTSDFFPVEGAHEVYERMRGVYSLFGEGAEENISLFEDDACHGYTDPLGHAAADFFCKAFGVKRRPARPACPLPDSEILATRTGNVRGDHPDALAVPDETAALAADLREKRAGASPREWLSEQVDRARIPSKPYLRIADASSTVFSEGYTGRAAMWWVQKELSAFGALISREDPGAAEGSDVVIALWDNGTRAMDAHAEWIRKACGHGKRVLVVDLPGVGAIEQAGLWGGYPYRAGYGTMYKLCCDLMYMGDSMAAMQTYHVLRTAEMAKACLGAGDVSLYCDGQEGVYGIMAGYLGGLSREYGPDLLVSVEDRILSQRPLRYDNTLAYLIPGMLAHFDYGDLM